MARIIIEHDGSLTNQEAIMAVCRVVEQGRISQAKHGYHYCWHTVFANGTQVAVRAKRHPDAADSFIVWKSDV